MRIGELARRTSLTRDTIRFYEREGLIASGESGESTNDYREYPEELVERFTIITEARAAGFSIADLRRLLAVVDNHERNPHGAEEFLDEKAAELRQLMAQSRRVLRILEQTRAALTPPPTANVRDGRGKR